MVSGKNSGGEKWRKSWTHLPRHPPNNTSHHWPLHRMKEGIFIAITMFSRGLGALREQRPLSGRTVWSAVGSKVGNPREHGGEQGGEQGGEHGGEPRGARWGTSGSKVGSTVGNPGEQGGEPRGARWGAGWRNAQRFTQHHRAGNLRWIRRIFSARNRIRRMKRVGRPGLPARPTSSAVCLRRQSLSLRLSQRRS